MKELTGNADSVRVNHSDLNFSLAIWQGSFSVLDFADFSSDPMETYPEICYTFAMLYVMKI